MCQPTVTAKLIVVWIEGILNGQVLLQVSEFVFLGGRVCYFFCVLWWWEGGILPVYRFNCVDQVCHVFLVNY